MSSFFLIGPFSVDLDFSLAPALPISFLYLNGVVELPPFGDVVGELGDFFSSSASLPWPAPAFLAVLRAG